MILFNADGSIRLPGKLQEEKDAQAREFAQSRIVRITRRAVSDSPLIDELDIELSQKFETPGVFETIYGRALGEFQHEATITSERTGDRTWTIRIISGKYRESWINDFRHFLTDCLQAKVQFTGQQNAFRKGGAYVFND